jgi:hypothetical protein
VHIPRWLKSPGMDEDKIASFYADCLAKAYRLRSLSVDRGMSWRARRLTKFVARSSVGALRPERTALPTGTMPQALDDTTTGSGFGRPA